MLTHYSLLAIVPILAIAMAGCPSDEDDSTLEADSAPSLVCDCPAVEAVTVGYDNVSSELAGANVQSVVDELAARDFADRITVVENEFSGTVGTSISGSAQCGGTPGDFLAIGGGCKPGSVQVSLRRGELGESSYTCAWDKGDGLPATGTARAICLSLMP